MLHINLLSDWRIGSGTGRPGDIDQLIRRDRTHCPYLPAKTITGIWRDACERVAHALDNDLDKTGPTWTKWVIYLFGNAPNHPRAPQGLTPANAHLKLESAHLDEDLRNAIAQRPALQAALTFVKPGVKISRASGSAEKQCFRLEEMARGGILLKPSFEIVNVGEKGSDTWRAAYALLAAGAATVERIGGKRRRGAGHCTFSLPDMPLTKAIAYLRKTEIPPALPEHSKAAGSLATDTKTTDSNTWYRIPLRLTTEQPVIISKGTVGNVVESLDYIPGSHLLPIIARHLRGFGADIGRVIAQSQLVITNALPSLEGQPTAPMPFCLFYEKQSSGVETKIKDAQQREYALTNAINKLAEESSDGKQRKQYRGGYISKVVAKELNSPSHVRLKTVATTIETHNTVEDSSQRPTSSVGGVYSYQAIPPGTTLYAELRIQADLFQQLEKAQRKGDQNKWHTRLGDRDRPKHYNIGVSRKDEYGRVRLTAAAPTIIKNKTTTESSKDAAQEITVWLLSDLLLRDDWLRPTTDPSAICKALAQALNLAPQALKLDTLLARQRRSESWQTRWGLPRPSLAGLSAGSCLRLSITGELPTPEALRRLEVEGLGERRVEGYGQLRLNTPLLGMKTIAIAKPSTSPVSAEKLPSVSGSEGNGNSTFDYARRVETAAWQSAIQRAAATIAGDREKRKELLNLAVSNGESKPSLSQLGRVRSQLARLRYEKDTVKRWVASVVEKKGKAHETLTKVNDLLINEQKIWEILNFSNTLKLDYNELCCTTDGEDALKRTLWAEAVETLVGECIRAQSRESERQKKALLKEAS